MRELRVTDGFAVRGGAVAAVTWLGRHPCALRTFKKSYTFRQLERLFVASGAVQDVRVRTVARRQLNSITREWCGVPLSARPVLKLPPMSSKFGTVVRRAAVRLLKYGAPPAVAARLARRLRVVTTAAPTVGRLLQNWRKMCAQFDPETPYACV